MKILVLNGPNLNRLGKREPGIYGSETLDDLAARLEKRGRELGAAVETRQTNHEGEMLEWLHEAADGSVPVILNAAAWTHTSVAVADAVAQKTAPVIEVHISNVHSREPFRHHSYISAHADGILVGLGTDGYLLALEHLAR
ncbi:type II 3-dehydroquinate dehydratase [Salininema proteolyticum]|uniref:3-dehydroquinate dehydratase n=1 Tax=Salininema proteolyticum TaxID=1607685 RepID=A0ABV8TZF6_9ACTN